jgi:hypothetical protein
MRTTTDAQGRAQFMIRGSVAGGYTRTLSLVEVADSATPAERREPRSAEIDLSWELSEGESVDLGKVVLREALPGPKDVVWVSGRVLDSDGQPLAKATVLASVLESEATASHRAAAHVAADRDGRFRITGAPVTVRLAVRAHAPGFLLASHDAVLPGTDLLFELRPAARWEGRLLLDSHIPPESIAVEIGSGDSLVRASIQSETLVATGLDSRLVDLRVRTREGNWLVESRDGLSTSAEFPQPDPRVLPLDLRGRLALLRLRLHDSDGRPLERTFARVTPRPWPEAGIWIHGGHLNLVVPAEATSVAVRPSGYRAFEVETFEGVQEIDLQPVQ